MKQINRKNDRGENKHEKSDRIENDCVDICVTHKSTWQKRMENFQLICRINSPRRVKMRKNRCVRRKLT